MATENLQEELVHGTLIVDNGASTIKIGSSDADVPRYASQCLGSCKELFLL